MLKIISFVLSLMLMGCMTSQPPKMKGLSYLSSSSLTLPVSRIVVEVDPQLHHQNVIGSTSLVHMAKQWAQDYFVASGGVNSLRVIVFRADIQEEELSVDKSPVGWFKLENTERYKGRLGVRFELMSKTGQQLGRLILTSSREKYVPENYSLPERRSLLVLLYEDLINGLTAETDKVLLDMIDRSQNAKL